MSRVLLAHYVEGYPVLHEGVRQMPMFQQHHKVIVEETYPNKRTLAIRLVGLDIMGPFPIAAT